MSDIIAPEPIKPDHDVAAFDCDEPTLNAWLKQRALENDASGASRTYVICAEGRVIGYYALAVGSVTRAKATGRVRRNMPEDVPVMILGRLAVDLAWRGRGLGPALLRDAILRTMQVAGQVGIRAILVHAISERAKRFYQRHGFVVSPVEPMTLMITVAEAERALRG